MIKRERKVIAGDALRRNLALAGDVAVIGTGAGGGVAAEILAQAGLKVIMVEEGAYKTAKDFRMLEAEAYPQLYQDVAARKTQDKAITIMQGKTVGGSTTVNWTTCFRAPPETLKHWTDRYGLKGLTPEEMTPWFERMERRLHITPWQGGVNQNNDVLYRGAKALGWHAGIISRNVSHCLNLGYCGTGCPVDAKQSMLVTTVPAALDRGAVLLTRTFGDRLVIENGRVRALECAALGETGTAPTGVKIRIEARHYIVAGGGINSPALLLRSRAPDPYQVLGKRTFLHVVNASGAVMPEYIGPFSGAPQSAYSNHFLWRDGVAGKVGYKLEAAPLHPVLTSTLFKDFGLPHAEVMARLPHLNGMIALLRDGFNEQSRGGTVSLHSDSSPVLDYPINDYLWEGLRHAYLSMAECQFAAGAKLVRPVHADAKYYQSWSEARAAIAQLPLKILHAPLYSAHVMGGCAMGVDDKTSVVNSLGRYHHLDNLSVMDGSIFPTSIGANPSLSIYAVTARQATQLAGELKSRTAA